MSRVDSNPTINKLLPRPQKEYGGYLPLELNLGKEYFEQYMPFVLRFNSIKSAFVFLMKNYPTSKIYLPLYYCPTTIQALINIGFQVEYYHIDTSLMPEPLPDEEDTFILLVDFFGIRRNNILKLAKSFNNAKIIIDNAHAFFSEPLLRENIFTVYSARKFFGVPDGAYLISNHQLPRNDNLPIYTPIIDYLLISLVDGTNAGYNNKKKADGDIAAFYGQMSKLSRKLLENINYEKVFSTRASNYKYLLNSLYSLNTLQLPEKAVPYLFPLLISKGEKIKQKLIENKIYVPTLWNSKRLFLTGNQFEINISKNCIFLPIDQRYTTKDMEFISNAVISLI